MKCVIWIVMTVILLYTTNLVFADSAKSTLLIQGNEINYESTNLSIVSTKSLASDSSLVINVATSKTQDGTLTLIMSKDAADALFSMGPSCKISEPPIQFILLIDGKEANFDVMSDKNFTLKIDVPAGSKTLEIIGSAIVGMVTGPQIREIPESGIYEPGQQVIFNGFFEDYCGNRISNAKIKLSIDKIQTASEYVTDKEGRFAANLTIPKDIESGRYKATFSVTQTGLSSLFVSKMLIQKSDESNIPFVFKTDFGSFVIPYRSNYGEIVDVSQYLLGNSLSVQYYATQNDTMEIFFPKQLMDAVIGNPGGVTVRSYPMEPSRFPEHLDSENHRVFTVPVFKGSNFINFEDDKYGDSAPRDRFGLQAVSIGGKLHVVSYNITGGIIQNLLADTFHKKLTVEIIGAENGGHLHIELPRNIIDSTQNGTDQKFIVTDSIDRVGNGKPANFVETQNGSDSRILEITFPPASRQFIEIQGTQMIPEFPFAVPVLLILFLSILTLHRTKFARKISRFS